MNQRHRRRWPSPGRTHEEKRRWSQTLEAIRGGWVTLLSSIAVLVGAGVVVLFIPMDPVLKGLMAGALFASAFWAPFTAVTIATYAATVGSWGESSTKELLKRERPSWPVVHDVPMQGRNVDHVAVSPRAVLAIETKYVGASSPWDSNRFRSRFLSQARDSARSVRLLLRSADIRENLPVHPVLMLWGPGAPKDRTCTQIDDVVVVAGRQGHQFLDEWKAGEITIEQGRSVIAGLERHRGKRRQYEREQRATRGTN